MLQERFNGIVEELAEVQTMQELKALWCFGQQEGNEYGDAACVSAFKDAAKRLKQLNVVCASCGKVHKIFSKCTDVEVERAADVEAQVADLLAKVAALKSGATTNPPVKPVIRGSKKYKLLSDDVSWSTKPQVRALMEILKAHVEVGGVLEESAIVGAMVANERVLETRQGGKRIWDYYKGDHAEGLIAHGNVEKV